MKRKRWGKCYDSKQIFLGVGNPFLRIGEFLGSSWCRCDVLLENQAVETNGVCPGITSRVTKVGAP